jgi:hypothetical protein
MFENKYLILDKLIFLPIWGPVDLAAFWDFLRLHSSRKFIWRPLKVTLLPSRHSTVACVVRRAATSLVRELPESARRRIRPQHADERRELPGRSLRATQSGKSSVIYKVTPMEHAHRSARACRMRRPRDPRKSLTTIDSLMCISSGRTRFECVSTPGRGCSFAISSRTSRSASLKSLMTVPS